MADAKGFSAGLGIDPSQTPVYGTTEEELQNIQDALKQNLAAVEKRYQQPNLWQVAAGFLKPQLGGFAASLGSASEALAEQVEKRKEMEIPLAQMRSQLAQSNLILQKNVDVSNQIRDWQSKPENQGKLPPPTLIANWKAAAPGLPAVKAFEEQSKAAREQMELQTRAQENAMRAAELNRQLGISVPGAGTIVSPTTVTGGVPGGAPPSGAPTDTSSPIPRIESGNQSGAYNPKTGAAGPWQVMKNTSKDPGFGVTPAKDDSEAELNRVGRDYYHALEQHYQNPVSAAIAYNMGPKAFEDWVSKGSNYADLPKETKDYVAQYAILQNIPNAKSAAESERGPKKILSTGESNFNPLYTQADAAKLRTVNDESLNKVATDRYASLESVANPQTYAESNNAIDQMIKTISKNPDLAKKVTNPLAQRGGLLGGLLNAAEAGMGFHVAGIAGNLNLPVKSAIIGSYDPKTERPFYDLLNTQAAKIAQIQQQMGNVNPGTIRNGEIQIYKNASANPDVQGPNVILYNLQYTKLNNEMLHEMYTKANSILNGKDSDYALNPNSRRQMMDILSSPAMADIQNKYEKRFASLNDQFQRTLGVR